jgi:REP-associated tyrosine transposase
VWVRAEAGATAVASYVRWLSATHAIRFRIRSDTRGLGHVYQDRYKAIAAYDVNHYLTLIRYIERNPLEARIVQRAEHWSWSSLSDRLSGRRKILTEGPAPLPPNWLHVVNTQTALEELDALEETAGL